MLQSLQSQEGGMLLLSWFWLTSLSLEDPRFEEEMSTRDAGTQPWGIQKASRGKSQCQGFHYSLLTRT